MTHSRHPWRVGLLLLVMLGASPVSALESDARQPMYIEADDVEVRESENTSIYVGNVAINQGSLRLLADEVTVYHHADRRPRYIIALGAPARLSQQSHEAGEQLRASAQRMEYDLEQETLTLIEDAVLIQGDDRVASERIVYERASERFRAGGGGRVHITLIPESDAQL